MEGNNRLLVGQELAFCPCSSPHNCLAPNTKYGPTSSTSRYLACTPEMMPSGHRPPFQSSPGLWSLISSGSKGLKRRTTSGYRPSRTAAKIGSGSSAFARAIIVNSNGMSGGSLPASKLRPVSSTSVGPSVSLMRSTMCWLARGSTRGCRMLRVSGRCCVVQTICAARPPATIMRPICPRPGRRDSTAYITPNIIAPTAVGSIR